MAQTKMNAKTTPLSKQKIEVGNLSALTSESVLHSLFARYGAVISYDRPVDRETNLPGKIAYIEIDADAAERAIAGMDGSLLDGQNVTVTAAKSRTRSSRSATQKSAPSMASKPALKAMKAAKPAAGATPGTRAPKPASRPASKSAVVKAAKPARTPVRKAARA